MKALTIFKMFLYLCVAVLLVNALIELSIHYDNLIANTVIMLLLWWVAIQYALHTEKLYNALNKEGNK